MPTPSSLPSPQRALVSPWLGRCHRFLSSVVSAASGACGPARQGWGRHRQQSCHRHRGCRRRGEGPAEAPPGRQASRLPEGIPGSRASSWKCPLSPGGCLPGPRPGFLKCSSPDLRLRARPGVQSLSVLQPAVGGLGLGAGLALPDQGVVDGPLGVLGLLDQIGRASCRERVSSPV